MGTPQAVKPDEIILSTQKGLDNIRERANAIVVKTPQDYIAVCNLVVEGRGYIKRWQKIFADTIDAAKNTLDIAKNALKEKVVDAEAVVAIAEKKAEAYRTEEKRAAEAEQRRINEENAREQQRKADEQKREDERIAAGTKRAKVVEIREDLRLGKMRKPRSVRPRPRRMKRRQSRRRPSKSSRTSRKSPASKAARTGKLPASTKRSWSRRSSKSQAVCVPTSRQTKKRSASSCDP